MEVITSVPRTGKHCTKSPRHDYVKRWDRDKDGPVITPAMTPINAPMYGIYPNLVVGMATNFTLFMCLRPNGVNKVNIIWGVTGLENNPEAQKVKDYVELCKSFNAEDREKLEVSGNCSRMKKLHR